MATKTKLEQAVEKQADQLDEAQRELVLSQFDTYKWNKNRMRQIESELGLLESRVPMEPKEFKMYIARRKSLTVERNQLATSNNSISSKLFMQLRGTGGDEDEFDKFFKSAGESDNAQ